MIIEFTDKVVHRTGEENKAGATMYWLDGQHTVWIPNSYRVSDDPERNQYQLPDDFKFNAVHAITRGVKWFVGVELTEEYSTVELIEDDATA